ncbi:hypothetical protein Unana1_08529 [Umbelopsis nana]
MLLNYNVTSVVETFNIETDPAERFDRMRWENIAFCGFQLWFCAMAYDSVVNQNIAEVLAIFILNFICAILGALEILDNNQWINRLKGSVDVSTLRLTGKIEIALAAVLVLFAIAFALPSYKLTKQLGWTRYKKIGADLAIDKIFRVYQQFILVLKINIFTEFLVSLFFVIKGGSLVTGIKVSMSWIEAVQIGVTALILPMLYFGRTAVSSESHARIIIFLVFQVIVLFHFGLMLYNTIGQADKWIIWLCFVIISLIFGLTTIVLGIMCKLNFGRGLKPLVQRNKSKDTEGTKELHALEAQQTWKIDD